MYKISPQAACNLMLFHHFISQSFQSEASTSVSHLLLPIIPGGRDMSPDRDFSDWLIQVSITGFWSSSLLQALTQVRKSNFRQQDKEEEKEEEGSSQLTSQLLEPSAFLKTFFIHCGSAALKTRTLIIGLVAPHFSFFLLLRHFFWTRSANYAPERVCVRQHDCDASPAVVVRC